MKTKLVTAILLAIVLFITPAFAQTPTQLSQEIINLKLAEAEISSVQELIDGKLADEAGGNSEWYAFVLCKLSEDYDFSAYAKALTAHIDSGKEKVVSTRLRNALALIATNDDYSKGNDILDESATSQGIMNLIFILHLVTNGCTSDTYTANSIVSSILSLQLDDGGWALTGKTSDVDVTAMAVTALAPYREENDDVRACIDSALALLSDRQLENGGYKSYGVENPESAAQVVIALTSLGIDIFSDTRFIKNGITVWDNILTFRLDDGSFSHTLGGNKNNMATVQALCAATAIRLFESGDASFYIFTKPEPTPTVTPTVVAEPTPEPTVAPTHTPTLAPTNTPSPTNTLAPLPTQADTAPTDSAPVSYKLIAAAIVAACLVVAFIILFALKKGSTKNLTFIAVIAIIILAFIFLTDFRSADSFYGNSDEKTDIIGSVTMSVSCDKLLGKTNATHIPADGIILADTDFPIKQGDTVYDILIEAARKYGIQTDCSGIVSGATDLAYVSAIANIYEFDFGDLSGWVYRVNGKSTSVGCGAYELSDGDIITWNYTLELGNDIE